jgi:cytochrome c biogenesis protein CcmG, thiol:disulfide interchange protein DsbE
LRFINFTLLLPLVTGVASATVPLDLAPLRGQVVYLDFWASWCVPCRQTFPFMAAIQQAHGTEGLHVIAVGVDSEHADAERFLTRFAHPFEIRFDPEGVLASTYGLAAMPASVLIDRHGKVRSSHRGFRNGDAAVIEAQVRALLAEQ